MNQRGTPQKILPITVKGWLEVNHGIYSKMLVDVTRQLTNIYDHVCLVSDKDVFNKTEVAQWSKLFENPPPLAGFMSYLQSLKSINNFDSEQAINNADSIQTRVSKDYAEKFNRYWKEFYESGVIKRITLYHKDETFGLVREYYRSGVLSEETPYVGFSKEGVGKRYYKSGELDSTTTYKNDKANGVCRDFFRSGKVKREVILQNNMRHGSGRMFYESGRVRATYNWKNGTSCGKYSFYSLSGILINELIYSDYGDLKVAYMYVNGKKRKMTKKEISEFMLQ